MDQHLRLHEAPNLHIFGVIGGRNLTFPFQTNTHTRAARIAQTGR